MDKNTEHKPTEVFHLGERQLQEQYGSRQNLARNGERILLPYLTEQHQLFFQALPYVAMASQDKIGRLWPTLLCEKPGFITTPEPNQLIVYVDTDSNDPFTQGLQVGNHIGILGIDFSNRRRNRINGRISRREADAIYIDVDQAYGNCPKYIQQRYLVNETPQSEQSPAPQAFISKILTTRLAEMISKADTCFITSCSRADVIDEHVAPGALGIDISHRGGKPGFIQVMDEKTLLLPDYPGNNFFNTLGNLLHNPVAGLLFLDFTNGYSLQLTGLCLIDFGPVTDSWPVGAERLVQFTINEVIFRKEALPMHCL